MKKFSQWIQTQHLKTGEPIEDIKALVEVFDRKHIKQKLKAKGFPTDLYQYNSITKLSNILEAFTVVDTSEVTSRDILSLGSFGEWEISLPLTVRGAISFNKDNQVNWCVCRSTGNPFPTYSLDNIFLFFLKNNSETSPYHRLTVAMDVDKNIHYDCNQTVNSTNTDIPKEKLEGLLGDFYESIFTCMSTQIDAFDLTHPLKLEQVRIAKNEHLMLYYLKDIAGRKYKYVADLMYEIQTFISNFKTMELSEEVFSVLYEMEPLKNFEKERLKCRSHLLQNLIIPSSTVDSLLETWNQQDLIPLCTNAVISDAHLDKLVKSGNPFLLKRLAYRMDLSKEHAEVLLTHPSYLIRKESTHYLEDSLEHVDSFLQDRSYKVRAKAVVSLNLYLRRRYKIGYTVENDKMKSTEYVSKVESYQEESKEHFRKVFSNLSEKKATKLLLKTAWFLLNLYDHFQLDLNFLSEIISDDVFKRTFQHKEYVSRGLGRFDYLEVGVERVLFKMNPSEDLKSFVRDNFTNVDGLIESGWLSAEELEKVVRSKTENSSHYKVGFIFSAFKKWKNPKLIPNDFYEDILNEGLLKHRVGLSVVPYIPYKYQEVLSRDPSVEVRIALYEWCGNLRKDLQDLLCDLTDSERFIEQIHIDMEGA